MNLAAAIAVRDLKQTRMVSASVGTKDGEPETRSHSDVDSYLAERALRNNGFKESKSSTKDNTTTTEFDHPQGHKATLTRTRAPFGGRSNCNLRVQATPAMHNALESE